MIKINKIPTILGIVILVAGTFLGVFYLNMTQVFRIGASPQTSPKDIRVGNVNDTSVTITWTTDGATTGFVTWGASQGSLSKVEQEGDSTQKYFNHMITVSGLSPNSTYYYKINSDGTTYDNSGIPWQFTTGATLGINTQSLPISGSVITSAGAPEKRAIVYLDVGGYLSSTLTSDSGTFVFQLGSVRTQDFSSFAQINPAQTLLQISVAAGSDGVASAQIYPQSASPIPPIVIGKVQDFRNLGPSKNAQSPDVNLNLPANATAESKFNVATVSGSQKPTSVILESITQGETITSTKPQFFGKGPGGENITITVHSTNPVTQNVQIPQDGSWSWSPPTNLDPGSHTITISWIDATGITRSLTRDFTVQASELPAFTASGSGSLATPIPTASGTATLKPIATPSPTPKATAVPIPVTGDLTPTLALFIMGVAVTAFSFVTWKLAENN